MSKEIKSIYIVGAGISGLVAAIVLKKNGYLPILLEATHSAGGRVKTDVKDGYLLDHGFQVLLEAYPKAKEYLNYEALSLKKFVPGAAIYKNGKKKILGDPTRDISLALPTLFSGIGSLKDKLKVLKLNNELKGKSLEAIFQSEEQTTLSYLEKKGFSNEIIDNFFKPFFTGIFLETDLETSSRMFEFVYKMFGEGLAVIPEKGIGAISAQLAGKLQKDAIKYNTAVQSVTDTEIVLANGKRLSYDAVILATEISGLLGGSKEPESINWKSCDNLYYKTEEVVLHKPIIGLIADKDALINNFYYPSVVQDSKSTGHTFISVTVVKDHQLSDKELQKQVANELMSYCGIKVSEFIAHYAIPKALPNLTGLAFDLKPEETEIRKGIFRSGDQMLNGSLNAAMTSGERAAEAVVAYLESK
jgi:protoporphyrinogen oxidase